MNVERMKIDAQYRIGVVDGLNFNHQEERRKQKQGIDAYRDLIKQRQWGWENSRLCCYFWFVGWDCLSLGLHVCVSAPNLELHLPFGFIRIGFHTNPLATAALQQQAQELVDDDGPCLVRE